MPLIFLSHRHTDRQIADVINRHLRLWGIPQNSIYQSSSPASGGMIGEPLAQHLRDALNQANVVLLVYTFGDHDWSYCMWECGVATDPKSPSTKIVVFQTTNDIPTVFNDQIMIRITNEEILRFTTQFHTRENFFPGEPAFAPNIDHETLERRSNAFFDELNRAIPGVTPREMYRWDFFTLRLNLNALEIINQEQSRDNKINIIQSESEVTFQFGSALRHFGFEGFDELAPRLQFSNLVEHWRETISDLSNIPQEWVAQLCKEMLRAIEHRPAKPTWALMRSDLYPDWWFYPVVNHVRINRDGSMEFQIYMYRFPGILPNNATQSDN